MQVMIDKYGRIAIPKAVCTRLGLEAGAALELTVETSDEGYEHAALEPLHREPVLQRKGHVLVHTGRFAIGAADASFDIVEHLRLARSERAMKYAGLQK